MNKYDVNEAVWKGLKKFSFCEKLWSLDHFSRGPRSREFSRGTTRFAETRARLADNRGNLHTAMPPGNSTTSTQTYRQTSSLRRRTRAEDTRMSSERVRPFLTDGPGVYSSWHTCMRLVTWSGVPRRCAHKRTQSGYDHLLVIVGPHLLYVSVLRMPLQQPFCNFILILAER